MAAFEEFGVIPELCRAVEAMDWMLPTDIQAEAIPLILGGGDVLMAAETGSGKTGAFCLPVIQIVAETLRSHESGTTCGNTLPSVRMSTTDREASFAVDSDGFLCQSRDQHAWQGGRANVGVLQGKYYYEVKMTDEGLCRVGWSTTAATFNLGTDTEGFGYGGTGKKAFSSRFEDYGEPFGLNDIIGCLLDRDNGTISFTKNGQDLGLAFSIPEQFRRKALFPACTVKNAELAFNFGQDHFENLPHGFASLRKPIDVAHFEAASKIQYNSFKHSRGPFAIIIEPSRELAEQTKDQIELFKRYIDAPKLQCALLIGGTNAKTQLKELQQGVEIVVGTPGRLLDFFETGQLDIVRTRFFILDEVDGLLSQGHEKMVKNLYSKLPKETPDGKRLQMIVCSATLHSPDVKRLANELMFHPAWIDLKGQDTVPETVHHVVCKIDPKRDSWWHNPPKSVQTDGMHRKDKINSTNPSREALSEGVKRLKYKYLLAAIDAHKMDQAIIFCRTKFDCDHVEIFLQEQGGGARAMVNEYSCACMHSGRGSQDRRQNLSKFKEGEIRFLICTDVAARGIDIQGIPYVINFTLPDEKSNYIHRIGRVGRADRMGLAISLVATVQEKVWFVSNGPFKGPEHHSTKLVTEGGCAIWYDEPGLLSSIQEHLGEVITEIDETMNVPTNEFDGQVRYGEARKKGHGQSSGHAALLAPSVAELSDLESAAQSSFISLQYRGLAK